jgi:HSP20 family molecular chaperone IbpA
MTRRPSPLAHGGIARALAARARAAAAADDTRGDLAQRLRAVFDQLGAAVGALAAQDDGAVSQQGEIPVQLGGKAGRMVFGYTVRMGLDGLRAEPFGDTPAPPPRDTASARTPAAPAPRAPITDLFEEPDGLRVVVELPGVASEDIDCALRGQTLEIVTRGPHRYAKSIALPAPADAASLTHACRNGILEVRLHLARAP